MSPNGESWCVKTLSHNHFEIDMSKFFPLLKLAGVSLAAYAAVKALQENVMNVPVVGSFLPGYTAR